MSTATMSILCAHCKGYHPSIAQVRDCATTDNAAKIFTDLSEAGCPASASGSLQLARTAAKQPSVPAGHYALKVDGIMKFYRVSCPTEGKWAGRVFVDQQAGDVFYPIRSHTARSLILTSIYTDPAEASTAYGHHVGRCGVCGRVLTNDESRSAGIGPVCRAKMGW